jgi:hypothetical protein
MIQLPWPLCGSSVYSIPEVFDGLPRFDFKLRTNPKSSISKRELSFPHGGKDQIGVRHRIPLVYYTRSLPHSSLIQFQKHSFRPSETKSIKNPFRSDAKGPARQQRIIRMEATTVKTRRSFCLQM